MNGENTAFMEYILQVQAKSIIDYYTINFIKENRSFDLTKR